MSSSQTSTRPHCLRDHGLRDPRQTAIGSVIPVDVLPDATIALLVNLSENGLALQCVAPLQPGSHKTLRWTLPPGGLQIEVSGEVVWSNSNKLSGLRLLELPNEVRARIRSWMERCAEQLDTNESAEIAETDLFEPSCALFEADPLWPDSELRGLAEHALAVTRADGAAIAIASDRGFICRASTGTAPDIGVTVQTSTGLTAEAIRTSQNVCCADSETDLRVDAEVCRQLNLRSAVIVPIQNAGQTVGVVECFWSDPNAFGDPEVSAISAVAESAGALIHPEASIAQIDVGRLPSRTASAMHDRPREDSANYPRFSRDNAYVDIKQLLDEPTEGTPVFTLGEKTAQFMDAPSHFMADTRQLSPSDPPTICPLTHPVHTESASVWPGGLLMILIILLLACIITFLYVWSAQVRSAISVISRSTSEQHHYGGLWTESGSVFAYSGVLAKFITLMLAAQQPTIFGDGVQSRDFTYADNVVGANLLAVRHPHSLCGSHVQHRDRQSDYVERDFHAFGERLGIGLYSTLIAKRKVAEDFIYPACSLARGNAIRSLLGIVSNAAHGGRHCTV